MTFSSSSILQFLLMASVVPVGVTATNTAVSLSNFVPRIESLPQRCFTVYTKTIQGCQESDFTTTDGCSQACVSGLVSISRDVTRACGGSDVEVDDDSIIGVFLAGAGIPSLCSNVAVTTIPASSTATPQSTRTRTSEEVETTRSTAATSSAASESASSSAILVDPDVPTEVGTTLATVTNTPVQSEAPPAQPSAVESGGAEPSANVDRQKSNDESGGGSPFDVVATGGSSQVQHLGKVAISWIIGTAALFTFVF